MKSYYQGFDFQAFELTDTLEYIVSRFLCLPTTKKSLASQVIYGILNSSKFNEIKK